MEIVVGILAAWGLIMLLWTLAGAVLLPLGRHKDMKLTALVRGRREAPELERYVKGLLWLRDMGIVWWDVVILADHLDEEARERADGLTENERDVSVLSSDMLRDWMEE